MEATSMKFSKNCLRGFSKALLLCTVFVLTAALLSNTAFAIPASPDPYCAQTKDGEIILIYSRGDEWLNWMVDAEGNLVTYENGDYYYATWTDNGPVSTNIPVGKKSAIADITPSNGMVNVVADPVEISKGDEIPQSVLDKANTMRNKYGNHSANITQPIKPAYSSFSLNNESEVGGRIRANDGLARELLVIYITWPNREGLEDLCPLTEEEIADRFFGPQDSVNGYYKELFGYDSEDILTPAYPDTPVWTVTLDGREWSDPERWMALPGWAEEDNDFVWVPDTDKHWDPLQWRNASGEDADKYYTMMWMMFAALYEAHDLGVDIGDFKNHEGDNFVLPSELAITFVVDGYEGAYNINGASSSGGQKPGFWASAITIGTENLLYGEDEVSIQSFFGQSSHLDDDIPFVIGTAAHELGHSNYGFKDLYDYGTKAGLLGLATNAGVGNWSLMDSGSWMAAANEDGTFGILGTSPCYVDGYNLVLGNCVDPVVLNYNEAGEYEAVSHLDIYAVLPLNQPADLTGQYFLLQQRTNVGYDKGSFSNLAPEGKKADDAGGLLIFHIDENVQPANNRINDKHTHMRASVEEAHGGTPHLSTQSLLGLSENFGDMGDMFGNDYNKFSMYTSPSSGLYGAYTDNTTAPVHNIESGVMIDSIIYSGDQRVTAFRIPDLSQLQGIDSMIVDKTSIKSNQTTVANRSVKITVLAYQAEGKNIRLLMSDGVNEPVVMGIQPVNATNTATFNGIAIPAVAKGSKEDVEYVFTIEWDEDGDGVYVPVDDISVKVTACGEPNVFGLMYETTSYPYTGADAPNNMTVTGTNLDYGIAFRHTYNNHLGSPTTNRSFNFASVSNKNAVVAAHVIACFPANESVEPYEVYSYIQQMGNYTIIVSNTYNGFQDIHSNIVTVAGRPGITGITTPELGGGINGKGGERIITLTGVNGLLTEGVTIAVTLTGDDYSETFQAEIISDTEAMARVIFPENPNEEPMEYTLSATISVPYGTQTKAFTDLEVPATVRVKDPTSVDISFAGFFGVTVSYEIDGVWTTVEGTFDENAVFNLENCTALKANWNGMEYQFDDVTLIDNEPNYFAVPIETVEVGNIDKDCEIALLCDGNELYLDAFAAGDTASFAVFGGNTFSLHVMIPGHDDIILTDIVPDDTVDLTPCFVPEVAVSAMVVKDNGKNNALYITLTETYMSGKVDTVTQQFTIANNAKGTYNVEGTEGTYVVYVGTYGNTKIDGCYVTQLP